MTDSYTLAQMLFPDVDKTPGDIEKMYPPRLLPEGAKVTRFAPSPTGFLHFGGLLPSMTGERLAHQSGGVFYLRIEDTDARREVPGAAQKLISTLARYGIDFDEGACADENGQMTDRGNYGPYKQSERRDIYRVFVKELVAQGLAYPCFTTEEELEEVLGTDKKAEIRSTDWEKEAAEKKAAMLRGREFTLESVKKELDEGHPFVIRILADGDPSKKMKFTDLVRGTVEVPENDEDFVLLKSDGIPTYHLAHAVDDHLMGTTHVVRGEEWLPSLPKHIQLFRYLGFRLPKYMHIAQIMKLDENGCKKKLSKRDKGANMDDYTRMGYAPACVTEYVMTLLNSNYEEWHAQNPEKSYTDFPFSTKKMSSSGCLFDFDKLNDVSKNYLSRLGADEIYSLILGWAKEFDNEFYELLARDGDYAKRILSIGRGGKKPRKDLTLLSQARDYMGFFFDELFEIKEALPDCFACEDIRAALTGFAGEYNPDDDQNVWFDRIKAIADRLGYASDMKAYKLSPESFRGSVADISMFLRVAVTGRTSSPDMYAVMGILGRQRVLDRIEQMIKSL